MNNKRIVMYAGIGAIRVVRSAYAKVFQSLGWEVFIYDPESNEPILDFLKKTEPKVLWVGSWEISRALVKGIQHRPDLEIILWAPNYGSMDDEIIASGHQVLMASKESLDFVDQIKKTHKLNYCFQYYHQNKMEVTHDKWRLHGIEPVGVPLAACIHEFGVGEFNPILQSSVFWCGGAWSYKAINMKKYLFPLCNIPELNVKLFGYGDFPVAQHLGTIATENIRHGISSATVCPSVFEPLAILNFDVSERLYKVMSAGGFCVSQYSQTAKEEILPKDTVVFAEPDSPEDFIEKILYYVRNPEERIPYIKNSVEYAYDGGNYYNRMKVIAETLGWFEEILNLNNIITQIKGQIPQLKEVALKNAQMNANKL